METKEVKIQVPEGYEIDRENSTLECIKFKPIRNNITYEDICKKLFEKGYYYFGDRGNITGIVEFDNKTCADRNNAIYIKQLEKLLALNQLLNIAEYYNRLHNKNTNNQTIEYDAINKKYYTRGISINYLSGISAIFNRKEDAQSVIDNPNFREILDTIYKD